jgi:hypothetical protein
LRCLSVRGCLHLSIRAAPNLSGSDRLWAANESEKDGEHLFRAGFFFCRAQNLASSNARTCSLLTSFANHGGLE